MHTYMCMYVDTTTASRRYARWLGAGGGGGRRVSWGARQSLMMS